MCIFHLLCIVSLKSSLLHVLAACWKVMLWVTRRMCTLGRPTEGGNRHGTVYPKKYAHGFVVLCFVVVMQSFIMNSLEVFIHIHQGCFAGTGAIVRLPQCQWSKPDGYGKISQCITTPKHSKAKTVCIFLGIYCNLSLYPWSLAKPTRNTRNLPKCQPGTVRRYYNGCVDVLRIIVGLKGF